MSRHARLLQAEAATLRRLVFSIGVKLDEAYAAAASAGNIDALDIACADIVRLTEERKRLVARQQAIALETL
jgi:hypothetical protein